MNIALFYSPALNVKEKVSTPPIHTLMDDINQSDVSYTQGLTDLPLRSVHNCLKLLIFLH